MVSICSRDIVGFLKSKDIGLEWLNPKDDSFVVASIFSPVHQGFYYYCGQKIPGEITNSLILTEKGKTSHDKNTNNSFLVIDADPQEIFYSFMSDMFSRKSNGQVSSTAIIHPEAKIGQNVQIDHFCVIGKCQIDDHSIIGSHTVIHDNSRIGKGSIIESHSTIGTQGVAWIWNADQSEKIVQPQLGGVEIGNHCFLGANTIIVRGSLNESTEIGHYSLFAPGSRIGHGTRIGAYVHFANSVITGGNTSIGDHSFIGSGAVFRPKVEIHDFTIVGAGAVVVKNTTKPGMTLTGLPANEKVSKEHPSGMPKPKKHSSRKTNMISDKAIIGENVEIHPLALIEDDVVIGRDTKIGPFCIIRRGANIGQGCKFTAYCEIRENVKIGDRTSFGSRCTISANAVIGNDVVIKYSFVLTDTPNLEQDSKKIVGSIGDGSLIGANVTLMPAFNIGKNAIIGACSQIRSNVGDNEIWFGSPAKFHKKHDESN